MRRTVGLHIYPSMLRMGDDGMRIYAIFAGMVMAIFSQACGAEPLAANRQPGVERAGLVPPQESSCTSLQSANPKAVANRRNPSGIDSYRIYRQYEFYRNSSSFVAAAAVSSDMDFLSYVHAISYRESGFNPKARSSADAYGLMQMTHVAMLEAAAFCHIPVLRTMDRLYDPVVNVRYGTCYLKFLNEQSEGDWIRTLILYNGGYRALQMYDRGDRIPDETSQYVLQVDRVRKICPIGNSIGSGNNSNNSTGDTTTHANTSH